MKLYNYWRSSSSYRVRLALHFKGVPYEYIAVSLIKGDQHQAEHDGVQYYFCAPGCKKAFVADPQRYLAPSPAASRFELPMLRLGHGGCGDSCSCG